MPCPSQTARWFDTTYSAPPGVHDIVGNPAGPDRPAPGDADGRLAADRCRWAAAAPSKAARSLSAALARMHRRGPGADRLSGDADRTKALREEIWCVLCCV